MLGALGKSNHAQRVDDGALRHQARSRNAAAGSGPLRISPNAAPLLWAAIWRSTAANSARTRPVADAYRCPSISPAS